MPANLENSSVATGWERVSFHSNPKERQCQRMLKLPHNCTHLQRRQWHPTLVLLPGKSHGWRSLVGCSPWGRKESDMTEQLHFHFSLSCVGEGNGNPLQCFCLENPRGGGGWWAAVHEVAKSWTQLSDFTLTFHFSLSCVGEGNGNPLQCSCLENPRDRGAW